MEKFVAQLKKFSRLEDKWHRFLGKTVTVVKYEECEVEFVDDYSAPFKPTTYGCERENASKEKVKVIPGAHIKPDNHIEVITPQLTEVGRVVPTVNPLALLQQGITRVVATPSGYSTRMVARRKPMHTTPKNANATLKALLKRIKLTGCIA